MPVSPNNITRCIYTRLEAASVGLSESQAKKRVMTYLLHNLLFKEMQRHS